MRSFTSGMKPVFCETKTTVKKSKDAKIAPLTSTKLLVATISPFAFFGAARWSKVNSYILYSGGKDREDNGGTIDPTKSETSQRDAIWLYSPP